MASNSRASTRQGPALGQSHQSELSRRQLVSTVAAGASALVAGCMGTARAEPAAPKAPTTEVPVPPALRGRHTMQPLPFAAGALSGLSERMLSSHYEKNYGGAVKNLNRVEQELARVTPDTPPFVVAALRDKELTFRNSKLLHEVYFANLGGHGKRSGPIEQALQTAYGSTSRWEEQFRASALGLGGGSGWAVLGFELDTAALKTTAGANHKEALAAGLPLLALDLYEHSYQMDFGAAVAGYFDAFFANLNWDDVNRRLQQARAAARALRS